MHLYGNGYNQYMDINNNLVIDRRKEKRKIKCVMIDKQ
jgi:CobQ-like glutamine amidotransferase family enzyme